jgi:hypothetical protein
MDVSAMCKSRIAGSRVGKQGDSNMIQAIHKGVEIELEIHELPHGLWKCDYTLITHPERTKTLHRGDKKFATMDLANEYALREAREEIDRDTKGQPETEIANPPRQVRI